MFCQHCGHQISVDSRFCSECGHPTASTASDVSVNILGNRNAPIITVGDRNTINQGNNQDPVAKYEILRRKKTPLRKRTLALTSLLSAAASLATIIPPVKNIASAALSLALGKDVTNAGSLFSPRLLMSFLLFSLLLVLTAVFVRLFFLVKSRTMLFSRFSSLPAITGWGEQINLVKFKGDCPICKGKLRFYSKPIEWVLSPQSGRRTVTKRALAAECTRNSDHWWTIDPTEGSPED